MHIQINEAQAADLIQALDTAAATARGILDSPQSMNTEVQAEIANTIERWRKLIFLLSLAARPPATDQTVKKQ